MKNMGTTTLIGSSRFDWKEDFVLVTMKHSIHQHTCRICNHVFYGKRERRTCKACVDTVIRQHEQRT